MNIIPALALVAILVFIHEFGHFIVAKLCGVHCTVFSLGYGKRLFGFEWRGTDYRVSLLPFGGYVMMAGADAFGMAENPDDPYVDETWDPSTGFMQQPVWKRILIVLAGPLFNLILPICTFTALFMHGEMQAGPVIGEIEWGSAAYNAGLLADDTIVQINGVHTPSWEIVHKQLDSLPPGKYGMVIKRNGVEKQLRFRVKEEQTSGDNAKTGEKEDFGIQYLRQAAEIGVDDPKSPAGMAGLQTGDVITHINGVQIADYPSLQTALRNPNNTITVQYTRNSEKLEGQLQVQPSWQPIGSIEFAGLDTRWGIFPATVFVDVVAETVTVDESGFMSMVGGNEEQSPAYIKGVKKGDRFSKIDGKIIHSWSDVLSAIGDAKDGDAENAVARVIKLELVRAGEMKTIELIPKIIKDTDITGTYRYRPILGTTRDGAYADSPTIMVEHSFSVALPKAYTETTLIAGFILKQVKKLLVGQAAVRKNLGGPVEIVRQASEAAERGWYSWVQLMSMISISLGVMNLMPLPVLDGGQLLFYVIEGIRGKPLPISWRERIQQVGVLFLVMLMLFVLVSDIERWISGS